MHILMISGSRNREGRTVQALEAIAKGVTKAGGDAEAIFLTELNIERCRQCEIDGWGVCGREQRCIIEDDFDSVVVKLKSADAVVFANPVYFGDLSESMRTFLERLRRISFNRPGTQPALRGFGIPAIGICMAGGRGRNAPNCCFILEQILRTCGFDVVDMIPVTRQNLEFKLPILELTGKWLVTKPTSAE
jgi:multimeric flavodoxin WrbA